MKFWNWSILALCLAPSIALAIVVRPGVPDSEYLVPGSAFPALVDLPGEGQGVLIAPRWVVTVAHAAPMQMRGMEVDVTIGGVARKVKRVITYPGFEKEFGKLKRAAHHPTLKSWPTIKAAFRSIPDIGVEPSRLSN
ncbi:MAG: hypothetical protein ACREBW_09105 [Candidatus Micrarchaeaceae archaeon]